MARFADCSRWVTLTVTGVLQEGSAAACIRVSCQAEPFACHPDPAAREKDHGSSLSELDEASRHCVNPQLPRSFVVPMSRDSSGWQDASLSTTSMIKPLVIAIDGPAGAGKSTVARMLARRLGLIHVDSGATYRAAALKVIESGVSLEDEKEIVRVIRRAEIALIPSHPHAQVLLDGDDVTGKLRTAEVTHAASVVSRLPAVRKKLVAVQRSMLKSPGVVIEGRDIGTVVFPHAALKIFSRPTRKSGPAGEFSRTESRAVTQRCIARWQKFRAAINGMRKGGRRPWQSPMTPPSSTPRGSSTSPSTRSVRTWAAKKSRSTRRRFATGSRPADSRSRSR